MSDLSERPTRGGPQIIPRPIRWSIGPGAKWSRAIGAGRDPIRVVDVRAALARRGDPPVAEAELPGITLPGTARRPAAVLCALFEEDVKAHVVLTRRSSKLRSHTHQVSFPGGRIDPGEGAADAALREAREEVGIDPSSVELIGELTQLHTAMNPAPITPFVGVLPERPEMHPNPFEVERAFTVSLDELTQSDVYREELWTFPDGTERSIQFFELVGDTVWGATAHMLSNLLDLIIA